MPPRSSPPSGLDEISHMIGELSAYVHEGRHGVNNLSTKFDALAIDIAKRVETTKTELLLRFEAVERRVTMLEDSAAQQKGARNLAAWFLQSPLVGWLVAAALFVVALWNKAVKL